MFLPTSSFAKFLGILTLESFSSAALGLGVGAAAPSTEAALAIGPAVMVLFIVFGGFYVNSSNVPRALRWIPNTSLIKQSFEGLCINEFEGLQFEVTPTSAVPACLHLSSRNWVLIFDSTKSYLDVQADATGPASSGDAVRHAT